MNKNSKRLYVDSRTVQDKKAKPSVGPGNNAVEVRDFIQKRINDGTLLIDTSKLTNYTIPLAVNVTGENLTNANNGDVIGSLTIPKNYITNFNIVSVSSSCDDGVGTVLITAKDKTGTSVFNTTLTANDIVVYDTLSIPCTNNERLTFEATTVTGNINNLSITLELSY